MARVTEVQFEQVAAACTELFRNGESVSFAKVYLAIGSKGGQQVVSDMIRRWRKESAESLIARRENPALPEPLVAASDNLVGEVWKLALANAEAAYQAKLGDLAMREAEWRLKLDAGADQVQKRERENMTLQSELSGTRASLAAREEAVAELESRNRELQAALSVRDEQVAALREDLSRTMATLDGERGRHDETLQSLHSQHTTALQVKDAQQAAELSRVHQQADTERRYFMVQTDELRQAHRLQADTLREQVEGHKAASDAYRTQAYTARDEASRWKGRAELIQEELDSVKKILAKIQKHRERSTPGSATS